MLGYCNDSGMVSDGNCRVECISRISQHKQNEQLSMKTTDNSRTDLKAVATGHCAPAGSSVQCRQLLWGSSVLNRGQGLLIQYQRTFQIPVVNIRTAQRSLYVPHSGQCMYSNTDTIRTAQRSLYVPYSGQCMQSTVVTICTAEW